MRRLTGQAPLTISPRLLSAVRLRGVELGALNGRASHPWLQDASCRRLAAARFKSLEALAYGIPLFASRQTLLGLPYLPEEPAIDLKDAASAARTICALVSNPEALIQLAASQCER